MIGHIKLDRKILEWEWYQDNNVFRLFVHLLLIANHKDGKWQGYDIKRGQIITGLDKLSAKTGLSIQQIRTCFSKLQKTGEITVKVTNRFRVVTICKYDDYQSFKNDSNKLDNKPPNKQSTNNQQTDNKQSTANNNVNNDNKENNDKEDKGSPLWFLRFYHSDYAFYKSIFNGKSTTEKFFQEWRTFVSFIYEQKMEELFDCKFINPQDFATLVQEQGFTKDKWLEPLKDILATGVKPEHNLFYRIPKFLKYLSKNGKSNSSSTENSSVGRTIELDSI